MRDEKEASFDDSVAKKAKHQAACKYCGRNFDAAKGVKIHEVKCKNTAATEKETT